jgi:hypothetical protein
MIDKERRVIAAGAASRWLMGQHALLLNQNATRGFGLMLEFSFSGQTALRQNCFEAVLGLIVCMGIYGG